MRARGFRLTLLAVSSLLSSLALAAPAQGGVLVKTVTNCDAQIFEQPFLRWADPMNYVLAPAGTLESSTSQWSLTGGAKVVAGNEPFYVHAPKEASSLSLPAGSSATTRAMCVGLDHPTLRFFVRNQGTTVSSLRVDVLFEDATGVVRTLTVGTVAGTASSWQPSIPMPIVANLLPLLPGQLTPVSFRFTPAGGSWTIDDVYVDPRRSH
jgi:hypothetical protein